MSFIAKAEMYRGLSLPQLLAERCARHPDKVFMHFAPKEAPHSSLTYAQMVDCSERLATGLLARGIKPGQRLLVHMDNSPEIVLSLFACWRIGVTAVTTNTRSVVRDVAYFAEHAEVVGAITHPGYAALVKEAAPDLPFYAVTEDDAGTPASADVPDGFVLFADLFAESAAGLPAYPDHMTESNIQFTSGTTSRPKAVVHTHANALWGGQIGAAHMKLTREDITLIHMPLFHVNAQGYSMMTTLWAGGTIVVMPKFSASNFWPVATAYKVTWVSQIPFAINAVMAQDVPEHDMRFWGMAADVQAVREHFGVEITAWWGMTETVTQGIVSDRLQDYPDRSIGRAAPEYEIKVVDEAGTPVDPGETGHLFIRGVRGVSMFKEYLKNPEANAKAFDDEGWFDTGDLIRVDAEGYLYFADRDKDMLKVGAENVAASEIESIIMETGIIRECAVVGQKHNMLDEVPVAFLWVWDQALEAMSQDEIAETVLQTCRDNLMDFKVPRSVHFVDEFPRSTLEKIAKNKLRAQLPEITE